jgi:hypothetical protein
MRISEQAKRLHFDTNVIITLREHLRAHKASLGVVIRRIEEPSELQYWQSSEILSTRLDDAMQLLDYYDQIAGSLLERQQNLLSLVSSPFVNQRSLYINSDSHLLWRTPHVDKQFQVSIYLQCFFYL